MTRPVAPRISVVVPCYNGQATLWRTLVSIGSQTLTDIEIIIVDDGSTDDSRAIAQAFIATDSRARLVIQANAGVAAARNAGIAAARAAIVAPIDADDLWAADKLALQLPMFDDPGIGVVYGWFDHIDENDAIFAGGFRYAFEGDVLKDLCRVDFIGNGSTALIRTVLAREAGGFDPDLRAQSAEGCEDWKLWLTLAERTRFAVVRKVVTAYRITDGNMSSRMTSMIRSAGLVARELAARHPEHAVALKAHLLRRQLYALLRAVKRGQGTEAAWLSRRILRSNPFKVISASTAIVARHLASLPGKVLRKLKAGSASVVRQRFPVPNQG